MLSPLIETPAACRRGSWLLNRAM